MTSRRAHKMWSSDFKKCKEDVLWQMKTKNWTKHADIEGFNEQLSTSERSLERVRCEWRLRYCCEIWVIWLIYSRDFSCELSINDSNDFFVRFEWYVWEQSCKTCDILQRFMYAKRRIEWFDWFILVISLVSYKQLTINNWLKWHICEIWVVWLWIILCKWQVIFWTFYVRQDEDFVSTINW